MGQDCVVRPQDEVYVVFKLREEALEAWRQMTRWLQGAMKNVRLVLEGTIQILTVGNWLP